MVTTEKVESLAEFLEVVCAIRDRWNVADQRYSDPWFRGHRDARWELTANIYRLDLSEEEMDMRDSYQRMGVQMMTERVPADDWSWYFIMQHYGAPTRLLDWTDGALLALLFAVSPAHAGMPAVETDAAVWMLDPWWLNQEVIQQDTIVSPSSDEAARYLPKLFGPALEPEWPIAIDPPHIARRIAVQRSHFTIFGRRPDGLTSMTRRPGNRLVKIVVNRRAIDRIRLDLGTAGVGETTVFPDLDGLSRELTRFWSETWQVKTPKRRSPRAAARGSGRSRRRT